MKKIAIGTLKGGTGKTMVTFNLAGVLAEESKVLLIDVDPQCNLSNNCGINIANQDIYTSRDIFDDPDVDPENLVIEGPISALPNLDIIPGHILLTESEINLYARSGREMIISNYIEDNEKFFKKYDYIIFDTNPSMGMCNQNAFFAADSIILVTDIDDNSRIGLELFIYLWEKTRKGLRRKDNIKALVVNKFDARTRISSELRDYFKDDEDLSELLINQPIKNKVAFQYATVEKLPVTKYKGGEESAKEVRAVVDELKEKGVF